MHAMLTPLEFLVSKMGFTTLSVQLVSILRTKFWKVVMKCKNAMFFSFWALFLKM